MTSALLGFLGPLFALLLVSTGRRGWALIASAIGILGVIATAGVSMFPFLMPSNIAPEASLTVWNASSSRLTLFVMLVVTMIFLPIVLIYTAILFQAIPGAAFWRYRQYSGQLDTRRITFNWFPGVAGVFSVYFYIGAWIDLLGNL